MNFRYADALAMADNHVVYKNGLKELAHQHGVSVTFMAKPDARLGSARPATFTGLCGGERRPAFAARVATSSSSFLAGWIACSREWRASSRRRQLVQALRGRVVGADDAGLGPRQPHLRVPASSGTAPELRVETRIPGADVNPYLAFAALLAAGLWGIEQGLAPPAAFEGNAYESDASASRPRCARRSRRSKAGPWPAMRSATRSWTTT